MTFPSSQLLVGFAWALSCALVSHSASHTADLKDTGITNCSNDTGVVITGVEADTGTHPRQDCLYGRDAATATAGMSKVGSGSKGFDFSKIANDKSVLPKSAALGTAAKDWACTRDNVTVPIWEVKTTSDLRSRNHSYAWYDSDPNTEIGMVGVSDWRMPKKNELLGTVNIDRFDLASE